MSKYLRVTHTYFVPMPDDLPDNDPVMENTVSRGISMMEDHMLKLYDDPSRCVDLHTTWSIVTKTQADEIDRKSGTPAPSYENIPPMEKPHPRPTRGPLPPNPDELDRLLALDAIEFDLDKPISFAGDVMGHNKAEAPHPWDQGLWIFPEGHPLRKVEERAKAGDEEALEAFEEFRKGGA